MAVRISSAIGDTLAMNDLDEILARLGSAPLSSRLAKIDAAVFAGLDERQRSSVSISLHSLSIASIAALAMGVGSTGISITPAVAAASASPFGAPPALAPSSLLLAGR